MTSGLDITLTPALFEHACNVYADMEKSAKPVAHQGQEILVYEGHLTQLFKGLRLSVPYYTAIKNQLIGMGCIEQMRRGGGSGMSKWVLWKTPTLDEWQAFSPSKSRRGSKQLMMEQRIKALQDRIDKLEEQVEGIIRRTITIPKDATPSAMPEWAQGYEKTGP